MVCSNWCRLSSVDTYWLPPIIGQQSRTEMEIPGSIKQLKVEVDSVLEKATVATAKLV